VLKKFSFVSCEKTKAPGAAMMFTCYGAVSHHGVCEFAGHAPTDPERETDAIGRGGHGVDGLPTELLGPAWPSRTVRKRPSQLFAGLIVQ
jgi:hypothetical protein